MLSKRLRPGIEAAPWVIEEVIKLELELEEVKAKLKEQQERENPWRRQEKINPFSLEH